MGRESRSTGAIDRHRRVAPAGPNKPDRRGLEPELAGLGPALGKDQSQSLGAIRQTGESPTEEVEDRGMIGNLLQPELVELIRQRNFAQLREILSEFSPPDLAEIFTDLSPDEEAVLMRILPHDVAAEVFEYLSVEDQEQMLHALGNEQVAQILNELSPDDRTALLEELPAAATQRLLNLLSPAERKIAADLLGYPKESIGRRMTPEYVAIQERWTVAGVLEHL